MEDEVAAEAQHDNSSCFLCGNNHDFELPAAVLKAVKNSNLVIFAGSGVSTEGSSVFPETLYEEVAAGLDEAPPDGASFPAVMSAFEAAHGRLELVKTIINRIRYAETFPSVRRMATRFHHELAGITYIREIITTNWDVFFEEECGAVPIVVDGDYAFYELPERKVYKVHGSLRNLSTIVATESDYLLAEQQLRESVIGGTLRHLLGTKVILFAGYSLNDDDFRNVYRSLLEGMGNLRPTAFIVSPFDNPNAQEFGLTHIKTDGAHFLRVLREHLVAEELLLPNEIFDRALRVRDRVRRVHMETAAMPWREHPALFFSLAYQDGLLDALNRALALYNTGEFNGPKHMAHVYTDYRGMVRTLIGQGNYWSASYADGYANGILLLASFESIEETLPLYELFEEAEFWEGATDEASGTDAAKSEDEALAPLPQEPTQSALIAHFVGFEDAFPLALAQANKSIEFLPPGMDPQHPPFLGGQ